MKFELDNRKIRTWVFLGTGVLLLVFLFWNQYSNHRLEEDFIEESLGEPAQPAADEGRTAGSEAGNESAAAGEDDDQTNLRTIVVHVSGEVRSPGVYELNAGDRVIDVVHRAGGETFSAELDYINLAAELRDGQKIVIPGSDDLDDEDVLLTAEDSLSGQPESGLININQAGGAKLQELTGIGQVRAQDIVAYRETHGPFSSPDELTEVPGIGSGILNSIRDELTY